MSDPENTPESRQDPGPLAKLGVYTLVGVLRLVSLLPLPLLCLVGTICGEVIFRLHASRRKVTMRNISACFPELPGSRVRTMARRHFRHMVMALLTMSVAWWSSRRRLARLARFRHRERLDTCLQAGRNVILLAPHFTSLEILGITLFSQYPMTSMYQRHQNPFMDRIIRQKRGRFGVVLFPQKSSLMRLVKSIRSGVPFYYLPDQDPGHSRGVFAPFFGIQAATHSSLGKLATIGNATVIPCMAAVSRYGTRLDIVFNPPLEDFPTDNRESDAAAMNRAIEELILLAPEQYFWSHKRFKTRPPGEPPFYRESC